MSVFSRIRTEYGPENSEYGHFSRSVYYLDPALREKCPNTEFFLSAFSCIQYGPEKTVFGRFSRSTEDLSNFRHLVI